MLTINLLFIRHQFPFMSKLLVTAKLLLTFRTFFFVVTYIYISDSMAILIQAQTPNPGPAYMNLYFPICMTRLVQSYFLDKNQSRHCTLILHTHNHYIL